MAFFFALAAKEVVEATAPNGALHSPRRAAMPLLAAVGGCPRRRVRLHRPAGLAWRDLFVVSVAAAVGFTGALSFATAAFPEGPLLDQVKMGALLSFFAAPLAGSVAFALTLHKQSPCASTCSRRSCGSGRALDRVES